MRIRLTLGWLLILSLVAAIGYAQQAPAPAAAVMPPPPPPGPSLSLREAVEIARRNSPEYRGTLNDRWAAGVGATNSTLELFLPSASVSASGYQSAAGDRYVGAGVSASGLPASRRQSLSFDLNYQLSGRTIAARGQSRANLRMVDEDIDAANVSLVTTVRRAYLDVVAAQATAEVARRSLERVNENLSLAQARYSVGQGTLIDVRRAEVDKGQGEVNLLRANQNTQNMVLILYNTMGVPAPEPIGVTPTDSFPVTPAPWTQASLVTMALEENPGLRSLRAREDAARWGSRSAKSAYLPSLNFQAGTGRNRSTANVPPDTISPPSWAPWGYSTDPWYASVFISLPLFDRLSRHVEVQRARAVEDDVHQQVRARELSVRSQVVAAFSTLESQYQTVQVQTRNRVAATEALELAQQRYRVGSGTYLELLDARQTADRADADYITAVAEYHKAIAALENAVGRPLR